MKFCTAAVAALVLARTHALDAPPLQDHQHQHQVPLTPPAPRSKSIAIIGAGSAGASTAYYLQQYAHDSWPSIHANITVYERSDYIGGRSTTVSAFGDAAQPVELGASIFVTANRNLVAACEALNLTTSTSEARRRRICTPQTAAEAEAEAATDPDPDTQRLGVWNGRTFVLVQTVGGGRVARWWSTAKLLWRYGTAPVRVLRLVQRTVGAFLTLYEAPLFPWTSLSQAAAAAGLMPVTAVTGGQLLDAEGVGRLFAHEVVQASTRVNYAQSLGEIHGLEAVVCMATDGAMSVDGGNWRIFDGMLAASGADVRLRTAVTGVRRTDKGGFVVTSESVEAGRDAALDEAFDAVVMAAPFQFANISIDPPPQHLPDEIPYVTLRVTLFASPHRLSGTVFHVDDRDVPEIILTTLPPDDDQDAAAPDFFSISLLQRGLNPNFSPPRPEYIYKIFSAEPVTTAFLAALIGVPVPPADKELSLLDVGWLYRKVWRSYPYLFPRVTFEELKLDDGLWYTSGIESFISTMETSSLMGMNIARLIADDWAQDGHCKEGGTPESVANGRLTEEL